MALYLHYRLWLHLIHYYCRSTSAVQTMIVPWWVQSLCWHPSTPQKRMRYSNSSNRLIWVRCTNWLMGFVIKQNFPLVGGRAVLNLIHNQSTEVLLWTARSWSCTKTQAIPCGPNLSCTWKQYSVLCTTRSTITAPNVLISQSSLCTFSGNVPWVQLSSFVLVQRSEFYF